jgi:hypothetical protein
MFNPNDMIVRDLSEEEAALVAGGGLFSWLVPVLPALRPFLPGVISGVLGFLGLGGSSRC